MFGSGFWDKDQDQSKTFTGKLAGLTKIAGIAAVAIPTVGPHLAKLGGEAAQLVGGLVRDNALGELLGKSSAFEGRGYSSFLKGIMDGSSELLTDASVHLERTFASQHASVQRVNKFLEGVKRELVPEQFHAAFDSPETQAALSGKLQKFGHAETLEQARDVFTHRGVESLLSTATERGIAFNTEDRNAIGRVFQKIARDSHDAQFEGKIEVGLEDRKNILGMLTHSSAIERDKEDLLYRAMGVGKAGGPQKVTWEQLHKTGESAVKWSTENYLRKVQGKTLLRDGEHNYQEINKLLKHHTDAIKTLFGNHEQPAMIDDVHQEALNLWKKANTGLVIQKGDVVSYGHLRKSTKNAIDTALKNLQIPLIPLIQPIPVDLGRFLKPSANLIKTVGQMGNQPELRRLLQGKGYDPLAQVIESNSYMLQISPPKLTGDSISPVAVGGDGRVVFNPKLRVKAFDRTASARITRQMDIRNQEVEDFTGLAFNFKGDERARTALQRLILDKQRTLTNTTYVVHPDGKEGWYMEGISPLLTDKVRATMGTDFGINPDLIHPATQLGVMLQMRGASIGSEVNPEEVARSVRFIGREAGKSKASIAKSLKEAARNTDNFVGIGGENSNNLRHYIRLLAEHADNPQALAQILTDTGFNNDGQSILEATTQVFAEATAAFRKSLNLAAGAPERLSGSSRLHGGAVQEILGNVLGDKGLTAEHSQLQGGILSMLLQGKGVSNLAGQAGIGIDDLKGAVENIDAFYNQAGILSGSGQKLHAVLSKAGYSNDDIRDTILTRLIRRKERGLEASISELGYLGMTQLQANDIRELALDPTTRAKSISLIGEAFERFNGNGSSRILKLNNDKQLELIASLDIASTFSHWKPNLEALEPLDASRFYLTPGGNDGFPETVRNVETGMKWVGDQATYALENPKEVLNKFRFSTVDVLEHPNKAVDYVLSKMEGLGEFGRSLADPMAPMGHYAAAVNMLLQMPQDLGNQFGLGLSVQDRITPLRTMIGFYAKRVLPLYVGYEAYKNVNANLHQAGAPGLDDAGANTLANVNLVGASIKDTLGVTEFNQWLVNAIPGLDQYFSPRSYNEYSQYLAEGEEEVRQGRMWIYGSRNPLMGNKTSHFRPNFYRRWKSHWTEAENVQMSDPNLSWLPSPAAPFSPLANLLAGGRTNHWISMHRKDRPYEPNGLEPLPNQTQWTVNSFGDYGATAIGSFGAGFPATMSGGGQAINVAPTYGGGRRGVGGPGGAGGGPTQDSFARMGFPNIALDPAYQGGAGLGQGMGQNLEPGGERIRLALEKAIPLDEIRKNTIVQSVFAGIDAARTQMGLYGAFLQKLPIYPEDFGAYREQQARDAIGMNRLLWGGEYGEALGPAGEYFRRFVNSPEIDFDAYSPYRNNMPSWVPTKFRRGDPYTRTAFGELQLPGAAYERANSFVKPLKIRGSAIGGTVEEMVQNWINPINDDNGDDSVLEYGHTVHAAVQQQLKQRGMLLGAEVSIYDRENNISGTIDAIVQGANGKEIIDIKTQGESHWGETPSKYIDQMTAYMAATGINKATLGFINRDNPNMVRFESFTFDEKRWQGILARLDEARGVMKQLEDSGTISPYESYDLMARVDVLSRVAPESPEFRKLIEYAQTKGGLGGDEQARLKQAIARAHSLRNNYHLYPRRYGLTKETRKLQVQGIGKDGTIVTEMGTIRLAGVELDSQMMAGESPEAAYERMGVRVGDILPFTLLQGQFNADLMADYSLPAVVGNLNDRVISSGYGKAAGNAPMDSQVRYGENPLFHGLEYLLHTDWMLQNKLTHVRSALEQFERGEVYGTEKSRWDDVWSNYVAPTISSFVKKDPFTAALQGGVAMSLFFRDSKVKAVAAGAGAGLAATLSMARTGYELITGDTWKPTRTKKQQDFDEYWDVLEYLKWTATAERAKTKAYKYEGVDLDALNQSEDRVNVGLGPWATLAIQAEKKAKATMYGFDEDDGTLQQALASLPNRQRQIAEEVITMGTEQEKARFYDLLGNAQRRVLSRFLSDEAAIPMKPNLTQYFKHHYLPDVGWKGWDVNTDMDDLRARGASNEQLKIEKPSRSRITKARSQTKDILIPKMYGNTFGDLRSRINRVIAKNGLDITADFSLLPSNSNVVNIDMDLFEDQTHELIHEANRQLRNS